MRRPTALLMLLCTAVPAAAQGPPSTDIFLVPVKFGRVNRVASTPTNITARPGYDNQPSFTPDSRAVLYTSIRGDGQSDIYRYEVAGKTTARVTSTPESEYSATVMPGGGRFSVIRVEKDSAQRLWSFDMDGTDPRLVVPSLKPVGYHAWIDANTLVMFVLGNPNALVRGDLRTGKMDTLARNIGRSLAPLPSGRGFSFTRRDSVTHVFVMSGDQLSREVTTLPRGSEDLAWVGDGMLLTGSGSKLMLWRSGRGWSELADFASAGLTQISRLTLSPDGRWLAIVAIPKS
jgi:hypothetical protein